MKRSLVVRVAARSFLDDTEEHGFAEDIGMLTQEQIDALMAVLRLRVEELRQFVRMSVEAASPAPMEWLGR